MSNQTQSNKGERKDTESCLFITKGKLLRVRCPFTVQCIKSIRKIKKGEWVQVQGVEDWDSCTILYTINGKMYPHYCFHLYLP